MAEYNSVMQERANLSNTTSYQHRELAETMMNIIASDIENISTKLITGEDHSLRNLVNGVLSNDNVNVHEFQTVGKKTIEGVQFSPWGSTLVYILVYGGSNLVYKVIQWHILVYSGSI